MTGSQPLFRVSVYLHIPFCVKKCRYCDFLSGPQESGVRERYVRALIGEIRLRGAALKRKAGAAGAAFFVDTVFIGGGTPSVLSASQIGRIMEALGESFPVERDAEVSMEMNPGTAEPRSLPKLRDAGINRLSIGVQSFHDEELRLLGRIHTAKEAALSFEQARAAGFDNINIDLMSALPGQTMEKWEESLREAVRLGPEHLSAYSLIVEPGTELAAMLGRGELPPLPDEETEREMFHFTREYLERNGYLRYEISNFARKGRRCRHNEGYWTGHPYLGMGIGAASYVDGARFSNISDLGLYLERMEALSQRTGEPAGGITEGASEGNAWGASEGALGDASEGSSESISGGASEGISEGTLGDNSEGASATEQPGGISEEMAGLLCREKPRRLTDEEKMEEFMFLGLRMTEGVRGEAFAARFGKPLEEVYGAVLTKHLAQGVLKAVPGGYCLTERGIDVSNYVLADYLL